MHLNHPELVHIALHSFLSLYAPQTTPFGKGHLPLLPHPTAVANLGLVCVGISQAGLYHSFTPRKTTSALYPVCWWVCTRGKDKQWRTQKHTAAAESSACNGHTAGLFWKWV